MKKVVISIVIAAAIVLVVGFVPLMDVPYQATETYYEDEPYEATETYTEAVPLSYEIVESYDRTDSVLVRVIGVLEDKLVEVFYPIGCVTLENTDSVGGAFWVHFAFYWSDRHDAAQLCHPDFDLTDYLASEDQEAYLDTLDWDRLDWEQFMSVAEKYDGEEELTLEPGQIATVEHSVLEGEFIDFALSHGSYDKLENSVWKWEYTITEPNKEEERERTLTRYRHVERERPVTHYKKGSIFEYLLSRFQG